MLKVGNTQDVDSLNPFIGYSVPAYEVYHLNYDMLTGYKPNGDVAPEIADSWSSTPDFLTWTFKIHPGINWQDGVPLTAKDVAFTYNYIIENDLSAFSTYTVNMKKAVAVDDATVEVPPDQAQGQHPAHVDPHRAGAHLEQDLRQGRVEQLPEQPADHRLRSVPDRRVQEERLHAHGRVQGLLEGRAQDRRAHLRELHQPGHHDDGPQGGEPRRGVRRPGGAVQRAQERARHQRPRRPTRSTWSNWRSTPTRARTPRPTRSCRT